MSFATAEADVAVAIESVANALALEHTAPP